MQFIRTPTEVFISTGSQELSLSYNSFLEFEPNFDDGEFLQENWSPNSHYVTSKDLTKSLTHNLPSREIYCQNLVYGKYNQVLFPNWQDFRLAMLSSNSFNTWTENLPATLRENLKLAAMAANEEALQLLFDAAIGVAIPNEEDLTEWETIVNQHRINLNLRK